MSMNLFCSDLGTVALRDCCSGCHDEVFAGFGDMMETELPNGKTVFHCCGWREFVDDESKLPMLLALSNGSEPAEAPSNSGESH